MRVKTYWRCCANPVPHIKSKMIFQKNFLKVNGVKGCVVKIYNVAVNPIDKSQITHICGGPHNIDCGIQAKSPSFLLKKAIDVNETVMELIQYRVLFHIIMLLFSAS